MSSEDNKENVRKGYDAFMKGDAEGALATLTDDAEYIITGDNTVAGTYRGKEEIAGFWGQLGEKEFQVAPREFIADGDKVVVLDTYSVGGDSVDVADVLTCNSDGQITRFESFGGDEVLDRVFAKE